MTAASLRGGGTVPKFREELMVSVMSGAREVKQALKSSEGMGSRGEVEDFMLESISESSVVFMGEKMDSRWSGVEGSGGSESRLVAEVLASWFWMISILEWKIDRKLLHFSGVNEDEMLSWGLRSLFMVEKRVLEWVGGSRMNDARVEDRIGFVEC